MFGWLWAVQYGEGKDDIARASERAGFVKPVTMKTEAGFHK